jgi:hypothetical protein
MSYRILITASEDTSPEDRLQAEARFRAALDHALGGEQWVWPTCRAWQRLAAVHGDPLPLEALTDAEREVATQWLEAEAAAWAAAFGSHRYMGDANVEILPADTQGLP